MACVYINDISQATAQSSHVQNTLISGNSWMVLRTGSETRDLAWIKAVLGIILGVSKWPIKSLLKDVLLVRNKMPKRLCQLCLSFAVDSEWANWWAWVNRKGKMSTYLFHGSSAVISVQWPMSICSLLNMDHCISTCGKYVFWQRY